MALVQQVIVVQFPARLWPLTLTWCTILLICLFSFASYGHFVFHHNVQFFPIDMLMMCY